jgi:hypothetical protein
VTVSKSSNGMADCQVSRRVEPFAQCASASSVDMHVIGQRRQQRQRHQRRGHQQFMAGIIISVVIVIVISVVVRDSHVTTGTAQSKAYRIVSSAPHTFRAQRSVQHATQWTAAAVVGVLSHLLV